MDEKKLRRLLRAREQAPDEPDRICPGETEIAAYVEHRLPAKDEARIEAHLADCDNCLEQVTLLVREPVAAPPALAPDVLTRARNLVAEGQAAGRVPVWRWAALAATAACVVLAVALQLHAPGAGPAVPAPVLEAPTVTAAPPSAPATAPLAPSATTEPSGTTASASAAVAPPAARNRTSPPPQLAVRNSVGKPLALELQSPSENAVVAAEQLEIGWREVPSAAYYEVHIVTEDGTVVWVGKVEGTRARPPDLAGLEAGKKYFAWVRAFLSGGGTVRSSAVAFRVGG
jgi:anti-sigma factor RsiW